MTFRLLVTGSRHWDLPAVINRELAGIWWEFGAPMDGVLVSGGCRGSDLLCEAAWTSHGHQVERHDARWHEHADDCPAWCKPRAVCLLAGPRRDQHMVDRGAQVCAAFIAPCIKPKCRRKELHGSHGATDTAAMAQAAGIDTRRIFHPDMLGAVTATQPTLFT